MEGTDEMAGKKKDGDCGGEMDGHAAIRLLHALNHKVRRRILRHLAEADGAVSPVVISRELGIPLGIVSYHVTALRHCKAVEQTKGSRSAARSSTSTGQ